MGRDATTPPTAVGGVALGRAGGKTYLIPVLRASALNPTQAKTAWAGAPLSLALVITELHLNFIVKWSLTWGPPHRMQSFTIDFEAGGLPTFNDPGFFQTVTISGSNGGIDSITGTAVGTAPHSGSNQGFINRTDNSTETITFAMANPVTFFGIWIGDMFDGGGAPLNQFQLSTDTGVIFLDVSAVTDTSVSATTDIPSSPEVTFNNGDGFYTFFHCHPIEAENG